MSCPFCEPAVRNDQIVDENDSALTIDMRHDVLIGSRMILPKAHRATPFDLTDAEILDTFELLRRSKAAIDAEHAPDGFNVGWNCGATAGQSIDHAHLHVTPRFDDEPLAGKGIRYWLKQESNRRQA